MPVNQKRVIGPSERPWAVRRDYQRFFGIYEPDESCGIFYDIEVSEADRRLLRGTFKRLPAPLQQICREYQVTFSTAAGCTASGNSSAFYADFGRSSKERISPHIEMSDRSLTPNLVLPHMTHEAAHLWWRTRSEDARLDYTRFLLRTCLPGTIEVTDYVDEHFRNYCRALEIPDSECYAETHRCRFRELWIEESFCDTVAALHVPSYPSYRRDSRVDLNARRQAIGSMVGLSLNDGPALRAATASSCVPATM
jgi:hypothetical protein